MNYITVKYEIDLGIDEWWRSNTICYFRKNAISVKNRHKTVKQIIFTVFKPWKGIHRKLYIKYWRKTVATTKTLMLYVSCVGRCDVCGTQKTFINDKHINSFRSQKSVWSEPSVFLVRLLSRGPATSHTRTRKCINTIGTQWKKHETFLRERETLTYLPQSFYSIGTSIHHNRKTE